MAAAVREGAKALLGLRSPWVGRDRDRIIALAAQHRLPIMSGMLGMPEVGALMSYGADSAELRHRAASYVDKIRKGAKPADLPVEQAMKFALVINLKTAKQLGLTISPALLFQSDQVI